MASQWEPAPYETHLRSASAAHRAGGQRRQPGSAGDREPASREPRRCHGQMRRGGSAAMGCCARPERAGAPPGPPDDEPVSLARSRRTGAAGSAAERSSPRPSRPRGLEGSRTRGVVLDHGGCGEVERPAARQSVSSAGTRIAGAAGAQPMPNPDPDPNHEYAGIPIWLEAVRCAGRASAPCSPCLADPCLLVLGWSRFSWSSSCFSTCGTV